MALMVCFEFWVQMQKCNYRVTIVLVVSGMVSYSNCSLPFLLMVHRAYSFSRTLSGFAFWFIFGTHPLNECEAISISLWLGSISLMPSDYEHPFLALIGHLCIDFKKCLFHFHLKQSYCSCCLASDSILMIFIHGTQGNSLGRLKSFLKI